MNVTEAGAPKLLVLGGSGMLGWTVSRALATDPSIELLVGVRTPDALPDGFRRLLGDRLIRVDAADDSDRRQALTHLNPDVVLNAVGVIKQDAAVDNRTLSTRINALLPHQLADECDEIGARLVQVSTDCVFSGKTGDYRESDMPDPVDFYGRSKLVGELGDRHLTLRTSIIGPELYRKASLIEWFLSQDDHEVRGFTRAIYSGVTTLEFARFLSDVVVPRSDLGGLIHLAAEPIAKYDLLNLVAEAYGWSGTIVADDIFVCDRSLNADALAQRTGYRPPSWPEMIAAMVDDHRVGLQLEGVA